MAEIFRQGLRYGIVGVASNVTLYLGYLVLTHFGMGHKLAMTLLFALGVAQTFLFNRRWTFRHRGSLRGSSVRYMCAYGLGYAVNWCGLLIMVDRFRWPHEYVQAAMIVLVAGMLFILQKFWVFRDASVVPPDRLRAEKSVS